MLGVMDDGSVESLRADATRNRAALVAAARQVFAERGLDAPFDEIARRAGVGNATLYRRFPTRQALIEAVFEERMAAYAQAVFEALAVPDPWVGFCDYFERILRLQSEDRGLADLMVTTFGTAGGELERLREHAYRGVTTLVDRAQGAGKLRADFEHQDLVLLLMANAGLLKRTGEAAPDAWRRLAAFVLDGLRTEAATPAPKAPSEAQVRAAMAGDPCPSE